MTGAIDVVVRAAASPALARAGRAYLSGTTRDEALDVARRLAAEGYGISLGYWHHEDDPAAVVLAEDVAAVHAVAGLGPGGRLSVKTPGLGGDVRAVESLARDAAAAGVGLEFDAHGPQHADDTLRLARAARAAGAVVGVALPGRWARSVDDAVAAVDAGLEIRLVKGQWPDDVGSPAHPDAEGFRRSFLAVVDAVARPSVRVRVATHEAVLADLALRRLRSAGADCTVELLLGLPAGDALAVARQHRVPVTFYLGYGHPSLVYSPRAVLGRPRLAATLVQGIVLGRANQRLRLREALSSSAS